MNDPLSRMLRFLPGSSRTTPDVFAPGVPYDVKIRVDNLGQTDASKLMIQLARWVEDETTGIYGWIPMANVSGLLVPGSTTTSGFSYASFNGAVLNESGAVKYRAVLTGTGVEIEHNELRFNVTVADLREGSKNGISLATGEVAVVGRTTERSCSPPLTASFTLVRSPRNARWSEALFWKKIGVANWPSISEMTA